MKAMMKSRHIEAFLWILVLILWSTNWSIAATEHMVKWVNDGDTIVLNNGQRVRYIGINAPEIDHENQKAEPFGYEARSLNQNLVSSHKIRLEFDRERYDQYDRLLAYIFLLDGTFVNAQIVQNGFAYYLYRSANIKYQSILLKTQQKAMKSRKGIWHNWKVKKDSYVGNRRSRRFHLSTCPFAQKIKLKNRVKFLSMWDAYWAGYAPAKKCIKEFWSY